MVDRVFALPWLTWLQGEAPDLGQQTPESGRGSRQAPASDSELLNDK